MPQNLQFINSTHLIDETGKKRSCKYHNGNLFIWGNVSSRTSDKGWFKYLPTIVTQKRVYGRHTVEVTVTDHSADQFYRMANNIAIFHPRLERQYIIYKTSTPYIKGTALDIGQAYRDLINNTRMVRGRYASLEQHHGAFGPRTAYTYRSSSRVLTHQDASKERELDSTKYPRTKTDKYIGVEIECFVHEDFKQVLIDALLEEKMSKYVQITGDGSLECHCDNSGDCSCATELRVLATETEIERVLKTVCDCIRQADGYINKTCGLHVHLDMRTRNHLDAYQRLKAAQNLLFACVSASRRTNRFCKKTRCRTANANRRDRYRAINTASLSAHETIEIRLHQGTIEASKIVHWIKLLLAIVSMTEVKIVRSIKGLRKLTTLEDATASYFTNRIKRFKEVKQEPVVQEALTLSANTIMANTNGYVR